MAITYGFYNSMNGDRKYDAVQLSSIFDGVIRDGVFQSIGGYLATKPGTGMQVIVSPGKAWFDHTWTVNDADLPLDISQSDLTLSRYDAVVLETDATKAVRENSIKVIKGTPASDPKKPTLVNEGDVHQHPLAYILVPGGSTEIQVQNIDIMVGKSECPFVTSILESVSIEALLEKWEGEFRVWFDKLQNQLSGDVAANLQNQINASDSRIGDVVNSLSRNKAANWLLCNGEKYDKEIYPELYDTISDEIEAVGWDVHETIEKVNMCPFHFKDYTVYVAHDKSVRKWYMQKVKDDETLPDVDSYENAWVDITPDIDATKGLKSSGLLEIDERLVVWAIYYPVNDTKKAYLDLNVTDDCETFYHYLIDITGTYESASTYNNPTNIIGIFHIGGRYVLLINVYYYTYMITLDELFKDQAISGVTRLETYSSSSNTEAFLDSSESYIYTHYDNKSSFKAIRTSDWRMLTSQGLGGQVRSGRFFELNGKVYYACSRDGNKFILVEAQMTDSSINTRQLFEVSASNETSVFVFPDKSGGYYLTCGKNVYQFDGSNVHETGLFLPCYPRYILPVNTSDSTGFSGTPIRDLNTFYDFERMVFVSYGYENSDYELFYRLPSYLPRLSAERGFMYIRAK